MQTMWNYLGRPITESDHYGLTSDSDLTVKMARQDQAAFNVVALFDPRIHKAFGGVTSVEDRAEYSAAFYRAYLSLNARGADGVSLRQLVLYHPPQFAMDRMLSQDAGSLLDSPIFAGGVLLEMLRKHHRTAIKPALASAKEVAIE